MATRDVRPPERRGRALGFPERGAGRGTRRRERGQLVADFTLYMGGQLRTHRGRRELAVDVIARDLRASPNDVQACRRLLRRARALRCYAPERYIAGTPHRVIGIWHAGDRLDQALAAARRGPAALLAWLADVADELARLAELIREKCNDRSPFYRKALKPKDEGRATARAPSVGGRPAAASPTAPTQTPAPEQTPRARSAGAEYQNPGSESRAGFTTLRDAVKRHFGHLVPGEM